MKMSDGPIHVENTRARPNWQMIADGADAAEVDG